MRRSLRWGVLLLAVALFVDPSWVGTAADGACELFESRFTTQTQLETLLAQPNSVGYAGIGSLQEAGMQDSFVLIKITSPTNESKVVEPNTKAVGAGLAQYLVNLQSANGTVVTPDAGGGRSNPEALEEENVDPWPITALTFVAVFKEWAANECDKARAIYDFLIWCSESQDAARVAEENQFSAVPKASKVFAQNKINSMTCNNMLVRDLPSPSQPVQISAAGSSLAGILFTQLSIEYNFKERWNVVISYDATGSGTGFDLAESRMVDFAASDQFMSEADLPNGHEWLFVSLYATAVVVMANVPFANSLLMTQAMVNDVFTAQIVCWNDPRLQALNPQVELPAEAIRRTVRNKTSGTTSTFTHSLARMAGLHSGDCEQHLLQCSSNPMWPQPNLSTIHMHCPCYTPTKLSVQAAGSWLDRNQGTVALVTLGGLLALAALLTLIRAGLEHKDDKLWRVDWNEVSFPDPPEILGQGSFGVVTKAVFRGDFVACKRLLSPAEAAHALSRVSVRARQPQLRWDPSHPDRPLQEKQKGEGSEERGSGNEQLDVVEALVARRGVGLNRETRRQLVSEVKVMVHVRHANVCPLMGACLDVGREFLIMQYFEYGSIRDMMNNRFPLTLDIQMDLIGGIAAGMQYLHLSTPALIHKDLKTANVLVDVKLSPKVSDFGMASTTSKQGERVGTMFWNAPELLDGQGASTATDVYAFAITAYEIFHPLNLNIYPPSLPPPAIIQQVRAGRLRPLISRGVMDPRVESLIERCWAHAPATRPSFTEVVTHLASLQQSSPAIDTPSPDPATRDGQRYSMFPPKVAALLRSGLKVQPQRHAAVSLVFADVVTLLPGEGGHVHSNANAASLASASTHTSHSGRTQSSSTTSHPPGSEGSDQAEEGRGRKRGEKETEEEEGRSKHRARADSIYKWMERLAKKEGLFKVRTIGSSFLAAAGLPEAQADHAARVARFATALILKVKELSAEEGHPLRLRIGCHSGPVVASVVGNQTLRYCLFGSTVNIASRLELTSRPNYIHLSTRMRALLLQHDPDAWRGRIVPRISSRGRGPGGKDLHTNTYWLLHHDPAADIPDSPLAYGEEEEAEGARNRRVLFSDRMHSNPTFDAPSGSAANSSRRSFKKSWFLPTLYRPAGEPEAEVAELDAEANISGGGFGSPREAEEEEGGQVLVEEFAL